MTDLVQNPAQSPDALPHPGAKRPAAGLAAAPLVEDFGDVVDRREYLTDDPNFGFPLLNPFSVLSDRQEGKLWPVYQSEQDLARIRGRVHNLVTLTPTHTGVLDALANYVLGPGFTFTAHCGARGVAGTGAATADAANLAALVQAVIDRFLDDNHFHGAIDREAHARSREDGEAFLLLIPQAGGAVQARFLECEQITQPADPRPLEDWLGCGEEFPSCWKFGVHSPLRETDRALGYHVIYDGTGLDWDYVPAGRMEHFKRNVPANAKRGVSDFFPVLGDLEREAKLRRNTAEGAALQAAIRPTADGSSRVPPARCRAGFPRAVKDLLGMPSLPARQVPDLRLRSGDKGPNGDRTVPTRTSALAKISCKKRLDKWIMGCPLSGPSSTWRKYDAPPFGIHPY